MIKIIDTYSQINSLFENAKCKNIWNARLQNGFERDSSRPELGNIITSPAAQKFKKKVM